MPDDPQGGLPAHLRRGDQTVSYDDLLAYLDGELDELSERRVKGRVDADPATARRLAALQTVDRAPDELRAALAQRREQRPVLSADDLEMSDVATERISAAIEAELTRRAGPRDPHSGDPR